MLYVIVADNKETRGAHIADVLAKFEDGELVTVDDTMMTTADLQQFLYPSLFSSDVPIIHAKFLLAENDIDSAFAKLLVASPTIFILEEFSIAAPIAAALKKAGALVHVGEKKKKAASGDDLFAATACITAPDKKSRWLAYRVAVEKQPVEAILGILYWKLRMLAAKAPEGNKYEVLYKNMLTAQATAWRSGAPLTELIEKVILEA